MRLAVFQKEISPLLFPTRVKRSIQLKLLKLVKIIRFRLLSITSFGENTLAKLASCKLTISTKESLYHNLGDFSTHLATHLMLDILYSVFFLEDYDQNYDNKIKITKRFRSVA